MTSARDSVAPASPCALHGGEHAHARPNAVAELWRSMQFGTG